MAGMLEKHRDSAIVAKRLQHVQPFSIGGRLRRFPRAIKLTLRFPGLLLGMPSYRPNIAAILQDVQGRILVAERIGMSDAWQFPQGGIDDGEDAMDALRREILEELGVAPECYEPLHSRTGYRYEFPPNHRRNGQWDGQEQTYFLCRFVGTDQDIDLAQAHPEFSTYRWIDPSDFRISWIPEFKRGVYRQVFHDFFGLNLPD